MGMHPSSHVAYGYALGGPDTGWLVEGLDEYGELHRPWIQSVEDEEVNDYDTSILRTLLLADGVASEELEGRDSWDLKGPLMERRGLRLDAFGHGGYEFDSYVLCSGGEQTAYNYTPEVIDFSVAKTANADLAWAMSVLDIVPTQGKPAWITYPSYG